MEGVPHSSRAALLPLMALRLLIFGRRQENVACRDGVGVHKKHPDRSWMRVREYYWPFEEKARSFCKGHRSREDRLMTRGDILVLDARESQELGRLNSEFFPSRTCPRKMSGDVDVRLCGLPLLLRHALLFGAFGAFFFFFFFFYLFALLVCFPTCGALLGTMLSLLCIVP